MSAPAGQLDAAALEALVDADAHLVLCDQRKVPTADGWQLEENRPDAAQAVAHAAAGGLVGVIPASVGLVAIDVDTDAAGTDLIATMKLRRGVVERHIGEPLATVPTRSGGGHMLYRVPDGPVGNRRWLYGDIRGSAGFCVIWQADRWLAASSAAPAAEPVDVALLPVHDAAACRNGNGDVPPAAGRNDALSRAAFKRAADAVRTGQPAVFDDLRKDALDAGLPEKEVDYTIRKAVEAAEKKIEPTSGAPKPPPVIRLRRGADIVPRHVPWLWRKRFAKGEVTLLDGDPGAGKSLIAATFAAAVTRGTAFPDGQLPDGKGTVVWLGHAGEDSAEYTLMPRFLAAGGDPDNLLVLDTGTDAELADVCLHVAVEHPDVAMVVIDSWAAWTDGSDNNSSEAVRKRYRCLQPLQNRGVVIQLIVHDRKAETDNLLHKASGTVQVTAAPRMALHVQPGCVTQSKGNLGGKGRELYFNIEEVTVDTTGGEIATGRVVWLDAAPAGVTPPLPGGGVQLDGVTGCLMRLEAVDADHAITCNAIAQGIGAKSQERRRAVKALLQHGSKEGQIVKVAIKVRGQTYDGFHLPKTERPSRPSRPSTDATAVDAERPSRRIRRQPSATAVPGMLERPSGATAVPEPPQPTCTTCKRRPARPGMETCGPCIVKRRIVRNE